MLYLVEMTLASYTTTPQAGIEFISTLILPTLAAGRELEEQGIIVAGGLKTGQIAFAMIMNVDSIEQLDEIIERLPDSVNHGFSKNVDKRAIPVKV